jgi:hypothetical protein
VPRRGTGQARRPLRAGAFAAIAALGAAFALPSTASAHGKSAPVATNFEARILRLAPASRALEAKVVDGDRALWVRTRAKATVLVPGTEGEPLLLFVPAGVFVNLRSLTAQSDGIDRLELRPAADPRAPPMWHRLTSGHTYLWHEHRLHALEALARGHRGEGVLGRWSVPLLVDGRRHELTGVLVYRPPGSTWPWILLAGVLAVSVAASLAVSSAFARRVAVLGALAATLLVWAVRLGRESYGRPSVGVTGYVEIAFTSLVGMALLYGLIHRDRGVRVFAAFLVAFGCLYQGLTMLPVLTHAVALTALPTPVAQVAVALILGLGGGVLAITLRQKFGERASEEPEAEPPTRGPSSIRSAEPT